jgi:uncharacterized C2H2 Zn-finger protein
MATKEFRCDACGMTFRNKKEKDAHVKKTHRLVNLKNRIPPSQKGNVMMDPGSGLLEP